MFMFLTLFMLMFMFIQLIKQAMSCRTIIKKNAFLMFCVSFIFTLSQGKCINDTNFKYDLQEPHQINNYYSLCHQFAKRTCCSQNNFDLLTKKILKVTGSTMELSLRCRKRLSILHCSVCDGDVGEHIKEGICQSYCENVYQDCKNDYFSIDSMNVMKVCREDDLICSKLTDIIANQQKSATCRLLDIAISKQGCWNGEVSSITKGKAKKKSAYKVKSTKKTQPKSSWESKYIVYVLLVSSLLGIVVWKMSKKYYSNWKRQIKNL